jgi:polysaccharide pyruvyl transferase WcaK-like protein
MTSTNQSSSNGPSGGALTILLRSGWQTANIGDVAHAPGVLTVLARHLPEASVILWPGELNEQAEGVLRKHFPQVRWVRAAPRQTTRNADAGDVTLEQAFAEANLLLHGPGAALVALTDVDRWHRETGKPWVALGLTLGNRVGSIRDFLDFPPELSAVLNTAHKIWTRETRSLTAAREAGVTAPLDFCPDATFALEGLSNEAAGDALLSQHGLQTGEFICVVPRLRLAPYWRMAETHRRYSASEIEEKERFNAATAPGDHAIVRAAIVAWVRKTGGSVLLCPEMSYATELFEPHLINPLPDDVRPKVKAMNRYWMPDEASSVYARARLVLSMECHSPILTIARGRPAIYLHQPQDTWKSQMYPDLGVGDWVMPIEHTSGDALAARVMGMHDRYEVACARAVSAAERARERFRVAAEEIGKLMTSVCKDPA